MSNWCPFVALRPKLWTDWPSLPSLVLVLAVICVGVIAANDDHNSSSVLTIDANVVTDGADNQMEATLPINATTDDTEDDNRAAHLTQVDQSVQQLSAEGLEDADTGNGSAQSIPQLNNTSVPTETKVNCTPVNINVTADAVDNQTISEVLLVNSSKLSQYLESKPNITQSMGADCALVIFYYKWCPFSAKFAKHFNALARVYPQFHVLAIDAYGMNSVNMRYGLVGIPSVLFFHNGKVVGKVNDSEPTIDGFVSYITQMTGVSPVGSTNLTDSDLLGPLSSTPEPKFDYLLLFSWVFALVCFFYLFAKSNVFKTTIETVRNNWREAEAQHEHND